MKFVNLGVNRTGCHGLKHAFYFVSICGNKGGNRYLILVLYSFLGYSHGKQKTDQGREVNNGREE